MNNLKVRRGEIWYADLNPGSGTEPGKVRPVVVLQTNLLNDAGHPSTMVCLCTSQETPDAEPLRVEIPRGSTDLDKTSYIMADQLRAIDNRRLKNLVDNLPYPVMLELEEKLKVLLDL